MKNFLFSVEELQELEALQIRGGGDDISDPSTQSGCSNNAKGCGYGATQIGCSNNVTGCGTLVGGDDEDNGEVPLMFVCQIPKP